ncbi:MAG: tRNA uridine-5-carboxymethylaminomethyl(34) synthesis GTPase MnmE, partial [Thermodesulfobacteriota bacterium]|nr:tRNA uridine-5-carboxymethylaminomethyl(34) synthesis GTPase MnmE [Thermodesulfobacteriota bacterium]
PKPHSYTCEDVVEINCHSGYFILEKIIKLVLKSGARLAQPGEFTKRAFLNGRIDLAQAESVIDLIQARTEQSLKVANFQLKGLFSARLKSIKEELIYLLGTLEAAIDFPEEDTQVDYKEFFKKIKNLMGIVKKYSASYKEGKLFRIGITTVLYGASNAGKSSLFNVLLKEERAIVTPIPGTTRDIIEEVVNIKGIPVKIIDTAGIKVASNEIEEKGISLTETKLDQADIIIFVLDSSTSIPEEIYNIKENLAHKKTLIALNKIDMPSQIDIEKIRMLFPELKIIPISALYGRGIKKLKDEIFSLVHKGGIKLSDEFLVTNLRHKKALDQVAVNLKNLEKGLLENLSPEFLALDLKMALDSLGEIIGETTSSDILNNVFSRFCIGK